MKKFVQLEDEVLRNRNLNNTDKIVYASIKSFMNSQSGTCFPSRKQIADHCGVNPRSITGSVAKLRREGLISVTFRVDSSNVYSFLK